ncbi:MAG: DegV family EDD domain-containing protein [Candidatus Aminicenantes bacterium]|nr:DegV family EDD domain-containing protein [Candidatus Aminicenantes bacterium]
MKIRYLDGNRLYYAFIIGGNAVIEDKNYLNKINVFPVPDADTGTNLASTMRSITEGAVPDHSVSSTLHSIAEAALLGARGNSGLIFAQFLQGLSEEVKSVTKLSTGRFGESVKRAVSKTYGAIVSPVEGTMLTVMADWADAVQRHSMSKNDFLELLAYSLQVAKKSLADTPRKLAVLAKAGVVDAGGKGFVDFLEGITHFIRLGKLRSLPLPELTPKDTEVHVRSERNSISHRYCSEALLVGKTIDVDRIKQELQSSGDSAIVAGSEEKARIHIHTDMPAELFYRLKEYGSIVQIKADDMLRQYEASHERISKIALVTDSSCDLPQKFIDDFQIHVIPFYLSFGDTLFLDKVTIHPDQFYTMLKTHPEHPQSSQPSHKHVQSLFSFLSTHYESVIVVHISDKLSGACRLSREASAVFKDKPINVIDSRHISGSLGLIVYRIADAIRDGQTHTEIVAHTEEWIDKTRIFVDIQTLEYMVRGGRVSPLKGWLAKILNLKPIVSLNTEGKAVATGKSFSRRQNMNKIVRMIGHLRSQGKIWNYSIVHAQNNERALSYAERLKIELGRDPLYIMDISPVVGVHNGIGALGIALMFE